MNFLLSFLLFIVSPYDNGMINQLYPASVYSFQEGWTYIGEITLQDIDTYTDPNREQARFEKQAKLYVKFVGEKYFYMVKTKEGQEFSVIRNPNYSPNARLNCNRVYKYKADKYFLNIPD